MILEEQFPVSRNTSVSKIGNSVISLLWQLRCHCNPDHNKFSSLSNTTVVAIFPKLCLWRRRLSSNLGGIGLEKLYRATLIRIILRVNLWFSWRSSLNQHWKTDRCLACEQTLNFGDKNYSRLLDMRWLQPSHIQATHIHTASYPYSYHPSSQLISTSGTIVKEMRKLEDQWASDPVFPAQFPVMFDGIIVEIVIP